MSLRRPLRGERTPLLRIGFGGSGLVSGVFLGFGVNYPTHAQPFHLIACPAALRSANVPSSYVPSGPDKGKHQPIYAKVWRTQAKGLGCK